MDDGVGNSYIFGFATYKEKLYIAGSFSDASGVPNTNKIARWNDSTWEALPNTYGGLNNSVGDLVVFNDTLIIGTDAPTGAPWSGATRVTAYDADINNYVDIGKIPSVIRALEVYNNEIYTGGTWTTLKRYIGGTGLSAWEDVGGHLNYYIQDLVVDTFNNFLYVTGGFYAVDDTILTDNVAIWNGFYWEKVGYGYNDYGSGGNVAEIYNGDLYVGKYDVGETGGVYYNSSLLRWDGNDWHEVGGGTNLGVYALEEFQNKLYVGGHFDTVGGVYQRAIACWQDTTPNCRHLKPRVFSDTTTYYLVNDTAEVQFYNNNAYVDTWNWDFGDIGTDTVKDPLHIYTDTGTYIAEVIVTHGTCIDTATKTIVVDYPVNVKELEEKKTGFKLYPNPTSNTLFVEINNEELLINNELQIFDVNGKLMLSMSLNSEKQSVDISNLAKGIYFVKIGEQTERFVKR